MKNDKLTIESAVKEEALNKEKEQSLTTKRFVPYRQNMIVDNTVRGLVDHKQTDMWGTATSTYITRQGKMEVIIEKYVEVEEYLSKELFDSGKVYQSAGKLLDCFLISLAEEGFNSPMVKLPLKTYAELIHKSDLKEVRKRVKGDIAVLKRLKIQNTPARKTKKNEKDYINVYLFGGVEGIKNGVIYFKLNEEFFKVFAEQKNFLYMPIEALQSNEKKNPHTYLLYRKIISHKRINAGKPRENTIKVEELYKFCTSLPRYEEVMNTTKQVTKRIIEPFERDLDIINEFTWHYKDGADPKDFKEWLDTDIIITWNSQYPSFDTIIEGRVKQQKRIEKAKQRALNKQEEEKLKR